MDRKDLGPDKSHPHAVALGWENRASRMNGREWVVHFADLLATLPWP